MNKLLTGLVLVATTLACKDKYSNYCKANTSNCCLGRTVTVGRARMDLADVCCSSCKAAEMTAKCQEKTRIDIEGEGRTSIKFVKEHAKNRIQSNSACDPSQRAEVMASVKKAEKTLNKAYAKWDQKLFTKWFGKSTTLSNNNVKLRFKKAMDLLFAKNKKWELLCCKKAIGACGTCQGRVLAYVSSRSGRKLNNGKALKLSNHGIRMCALSFTQKDKAVELGMTMSSSAGDKGYKKRECFNLARTNPELARQNSAAYVYFAMESVFNKPDYERYSKGMSIMNE